MWMVDIGNDEVSPAQTSDGVDGIKPFFRCMFSFLSCHRRPGTCPRQDARRSREPEMGQYFHWSAGGWPLWNAWGSRSCEAQPCTKMESSPGDAQMWLEPWMAALPQYQEVLPEEIPGAPGVLPGTLLTLPPHQEGTSDGAPGAHLGHYKRGRLPSEAEPELGGRRRSL